MEIIHQLTMTAIEYALASFLEDYVDPQTAREIANGVVTSLDLALKGRNKAIDEKLGFADNNSSSNGKRYDENQQAVIDLAKEAKRKGGVTLGEAEILIEFANEYGVPNHGPEVHPTRPGPASNVLHFHIANVAHIIIKIAGDD